MSHTYIYQADAVEKCKPSRRTGSPQEVRQSATACRQTINCANLLTSVTTAMHSIFAGYSQSTRQNGLAERGYYFAVNAAGRCNYQRCRLEARRIAARQARRPWSPGDYITDRRRRFT